MAISFCLCSRGLLLAGDGEGGAGGDGVGGDEGDDAGEVALGTADGVVGDGDEGGVAGGYGLVGVGDGGAVARCHGAEHADRVGSSVDDLEVVGDGTNDAPEVVTGAVKMQ